MNLETVHNRAMQLSEEHLQHQQAGNAAQSQKLALQALALEKLCAEQALAKGLEELSTSSPLEELEDIQIMFKLTTAGILHHSAAHLAIDAGELEEARELQNWPERVPEKWRAAALKMRSAADPRKEGSARLEQALKKTNETHQKAEEMLLGITHNLVIRTQHDEYEAVREALHTLFVQRLITQIETTKMKSIDPEGSKVEDHWYIEVKQREPDKKTGTIPLRIGQPRHVKMLRDWHKMPTIQRRDHWWHFARSEEEAKRLLQKYLEEGPEIRTTPELEGLFERFARGEGQDKVAELNGIRLKPDLWGLIRVSLESRHLEKHWTELSKYQVQTYGQDICAQMLGVEPEGHVEKKMFTEEDLPF